MINLEESYILDEEKYFPDHWDDQTKKLVRFMLKEAFRYAYTKGYDKGRESGLNCAMQINEEMTKKFIEMKDRYNSIPEIIGEIKRS